MQSNQQHPNTSAFPQLRTYRPHPFGGRNQDVRLNLPRCQARVSHGGAGASCSGCDGEKRGWDIPHYDKPRSVRSWGKTGVTKQKEPSGRRRRVGSHETRADGTENTGVIIAMRNAIYTVAAIVTAFAVIWAALAIGCSIVTDSIVVWPWMGVM